MRIRVGITIDASPAAVWAAVERIDTHVNWMADAQSITFLTKQTSGVGTTFDCLTKVGPIRLVDRMVVTGWNPKRTIGIEHRGAVSGRGRFTLRRRRGRTRFTWTEQLAFPWWLGGPAGALAARPVLRAVWRRNLRRLKDLVEDRTSREDAWRNVP